MNSNPKPNSPSFLASIISLPAVGIGALGDAMKDTSPELGYSLTILGGMIGGITGYQSNRLASAADAADGLAPASAEEIGLNHHLARLAGHSLRTIIEELAESKPENSAERHALESAATRATPAWLIVLKAPSGEHFRKLNSRRLTDVVAGHAVAPGGVETLTVEHWLPFARYVLGGTGTVEPPLAVELAGKFEREFARHFFEHIKLSAKKDPPAFAALQIQFLADVRFAMHSHGQEFVALRAQLDQMIGKIGDLTQRTLTAPDFDWDRLTAALAESQIAQAEARHFFEKQGRNWDEILPLARDTYRLLDGVAMSQDSLMKSVAGIDEWLKAQISELISAFRAGERGRERESTAAYILGRVLRQRRKSDEIKRDAASLVIRRANILSLTARPYQQSDDWSPGDKAVESRRTPPPAMVVRPPLRSGDDVPAHGTNFYLFGRSGHGKSTLAAAIAKRLARRHYVVLFVDLRNDGESAREKLAEFAGNDWLKLAPPDALIRQGGIAGKSDVEDLWPESDIDGRVVAVTSWFHADRGESPEGRPPKHPRFCLVWDNVDDPYTLDYLLRLHLLNHGGVQIITSRIAPVDLPMDSSHPYPEGLPEDFQCFEVGPYTESEAREVLRLAGEAAQRQGGCIPAPELVERILTATHLDGIPFRYDPLLLGQIIRVGRNKRWEIEDMLVASPTELSGAPSALLTEQELLERTLSKLGPLSRAIWNLLVHLAAAPVPRDFWEPIENMLRLGGEMTASEREAIEEDLEDELPFERARTALADAGLLSRSDTGDFIHARHHAQGRELTALEVRPSLYRQVVRVLYSAAPSKDPFEDMSTWPFYRAAESHLFAALSPERAAEIISMREAGWLTNHFGQYLIEQSRLVEAQAIETLNMECNIAVFGRDSSDHATSLHELARVQLAQGRYAEAEFGLQQALGTYVSILGENHRDVATTRATLARVHQEQGRYMEAEGGYRKALETYLPVHGENHRDVATTWHGLARVYLARGQYVEAEAGFQKALGIYVRIIGENSWEAAISRSNLARVMWATDRQAEAHVLFEEALARMESILGEDHPRVAMALFRRVECEIGAIPSEMGAIKVSVEGLTRLRRALAIQESKLGNHHPESNEIRLLLAECLRREGDSAGARDAAKFAVAVFRHTLPAEHSRIRQAEALLHQIGKT